MSCRTALCLFDAAHVFDCATDSCTPFPDYSLTSRIVGSRMLCPFGRATFDHANASGTTSNVGATAWTQNWQADGRLRTGARRHSNTPHGVGCTHWTVRATRARGLLVHVDAEVTSGAEIGHRRTAFLRALHGNDQARFDDRRRARRKRNSFRGDRRGATSNPEPRVDDGFGRWRWMVKMAPDCGLGRGAADSWKLRVKLCVFPKRRVSCSNIP